MHSEVTVVALEIRPVTRSIKLAVKGLADVVVTTAVLGRLTATEIVAAKPFLCAGGSLKKGGVSIK
jgi:hypothetical protein